MEQISQQILSLADSNFKYILIFFNLMTLIVVYIHKNKQKNNKQHHVLFVIAHPDDEVMFFRPSIVSITKDYFVHLLCLSGGQTQRQNQLKNSVQNLKIHKFICLNNQKLKDDIELAWPKQEIQKIVNEYILENNIKAIFTFDQNGVSNHINHKSIFYSLQQLHYPIEKLRILNKKAENLTQDERTTIQSIKNLSIKIYHLKTVNFVRKYSGFFQIVFALLRDFSWINLNVVDAYRSMAIHKTQFIWYRKLWVFFSQYSFINIYSMTRMGINSSKSLQNLNMQEKQIKSTEKAEKVQIQDKKCK